MTIEEVTISHQWEKRFRLKTTLILNLTGHLSGQVRGGQVTSSTAAASSSGEKKKRKKMRQERHEERKQSESVADYVNDYRL